MTEQEISQNIQDTQDTQDKHYFINISTDNDIYSSVGYVKNTFDKEIKLDISQEDSLNNNYKFYKILDNKIPVTISPYKLISSCTIPALSEKYMYRELNEFVPGDHPKFKSSLNILYISSKPNLDNYKKHNFKHLTSSIVSNSCGYIPTYTKHNMLVDISQFIFFGLNPDELTESFKMKTEKYYDMYQVKGDKLKKTLKFLCNKLRDEPVHIVFDLDILSTNISPLSMRDTLLVREDKDNINLEELTLILQELKKLNIVGLDIVNYFLINDDKSIVNRIQAETIQKIYGTLLKLTTKSFNVFNEHSLFLIFKPVDEIEDTDINDDNNIGWYIMRGINSIEQREEIMSKIIDGQIIMIKIEDTDIKNENDNIEKYIYVTTTSMYDQNELSYYSCDSFLDKRLYPDEKVDMMFELVNV
jgi:hypothetical protein